MGWVRISAVCIASDEVGVMKCVDEDGDCREGSSMEKGMGSPFYGAGRPCGAVDWLIGLMERDAPV